MKAFLEKNKIHITIIFAAFIIAGSIWESNRSGTLGPQSETYIQSRPLQLLETAEPQEVNKTEEQPHCANSIDYTKAPNHVGEYACVTGKIDHVYTSQKGVTFLNFCPDYQICPFGAVIFGSDASKFPDPKQYEQKIVEITGLIKSYQSRPEIILADPCQIRILSLKSSSVKKDPVLCMVAAIIDGDTIKVDIGGETETVRLIGIDTPEIANSQNTGQEYFGTEAAQYTKQLIENKLVYLIPDPMQSDRDKYGRILRYVFLKDGTFINAKLIREGYAYNYIYEPFQFMKYFYTLEKLAKEDRFGMWADKKNRAKKR
ncbi:MAG: thermonuclease family protein [Phycisphaerae bacterium]|jgi:micrococcal nuclease